MPRHEDKRGAKSRVERLSVLFLQRLHEIAGSVYATGLSSGAIRPEEMEAEIQRYFARKKSGLQDVYSYYAEQWDYFYRVEAASDADFLPMLQQARSAFARLYAPSDLDVTFYTEQMVRYPRTDGRWQTLRRHFMDKWRRLLEGREERYQEQHIARLSKEYFRMASDMARMLQNAGKAGDGLSPRLAWLQMTVSPELRAKIRQLSQVIRKSRLIKELNQALGRKKADEQRLYQAVRGRSPVELCLPAAHSDIVGITEGNDLNALLPVEYCYLSDPALEPIFFRRYAERKLAVFDSVSHRIERVDASLRRGRDMQRHRRQGPFVVCVDTSGSMEGEREVFSKAIVLSLALMADRLRRPCRIVFFSDQTEVVELENLYEDLPSLETFLCRTFHGGSDMGCAMRDAVTALMREDFRYADLLWISDFEMEPLSPVWVQYVDELKQRGMRLYAVSFGRRAEQSYLDLADRVWKAASVD